MSSSGGYWKAQSKWNLPGAKDESYQKRSSFHLMKYRVLLSQTAVSQLSLLNAKEAIRIKEALHQLQEDPFRKRSGSDIKKLVTPDEPPLFRLRIGHYRAIYFVIGQDVRITEIIHRSKGHKWLE